MKKADIKAVAENRFRELGAKQLELYPSGICWTMNGEFFKVSLLTDFWVLEWTDNHSNAFPLLLHLRSVRQIHTLLSTGIL